MNECEKEAVLKNNMLCSKILHFFDIARQKNNLFILPRVADVAMENGLQEISPFKQIIEWNEKRKEDEENEERKKNQEESIRDERMREIMDEEAYFDGSDDNEDEMNNGIEDNEMKVEEEEEKKEEEEKEEENDDNPLSSFFKSKRTNPSSSTMKLTWNINLSSPVADNETKRMKLEEN